MTTRTAVHQEERVRRHTASHVNQQIDRKIADSVRAFSNQPPSAISRRIRELDQEWDVERVLETNASTLAMIGLALGSTVNRKWLWLSGAVLGFLFLHGTQGWCPPLPVLRRMGIRTRREIDREKYALKQLRGDFAGANLRSALSQVRTGDVLQAVGS
jgi:hypothetical protein